MQSGQNHLTKVMLVLGILEAIRNALLEFLSPDQNFPHNYHSPHPPTLTISTSLKSLYFFNFRSPSHLNAYFCANHAPVTMLSFSRNCPKHLGSPVIATTAFWTVLLVTSVGRSMSSLESIWRVHEMPNRDVAGDVEVAFCRSVKYEKSSVDLGSFSMVACQGRSLGLNRRVYPICECHERKEGPSIVNCWICAMLHPEPFFDLRSPVTPST